MFCKNCGDNTKGKFCHNCGQKTNTHRLTIKHFFAHDLLHGMLHLDKGLPLTIKDILIRPGHVAQDYIYGKRKKYYNFFYLLLLIIGFYLFLKSIGSTEELHAALDEASPLNDNEIAGQQINNFFKHNKKIVIFSWIPILTLAAAIVFKRLKFSIIEFAIPATIAVIGSSFFNIALTTSNQFIPATGTLSGIVGLLNSFLTFSVVLFPLFTFATFIKDHYSTLGKVWRLLAFYSLCIIILLSILIIAVFIVTKGKGEVVFS